jgi:hypothetical protein
MRDEKWEMWSIVNTIFTLLLWSSINRGVLPLCTYLRWKEKNTKAPPLPLYSNYVCLYSLCSCVLSAKETWFLTCIFTLATRTRSESRCELLPLSQNIKSCWLLLITFDRSSYSKNLWKYYLICYDMFYHHVYFKYIIIIFTLSIFLNKTSSQMWSTKVNKTLYSGTEGVRTFEDSGYQWAWYASGYS